MYQEASKTAGLILWHLEVLNIIYRDSGKVKRNRRYISNHTPYILNILLLRPVLVYYVKLGLGPVGREIGLKKVS